MGNLIKLVILVTQDIVGIATPIPTNVLGHVLESLLSEQQEIQSRLDRIEQKLDMHIIQPYRNGVLFLEQGVRSNKKETRQRRILDAQRELFVASQIELEEYPFIPIKALTYAGLCSDLLADSEDALNLYRQAHLVAVNYLWSNNDVFYRNRIRSIYKGLGQSKIKFSPYQLHSMKIKPVLGEQHINDPRTTSIELPNEKDHQAWIKKVQGSGLSLHNIPEKNMFDPDKRDSIMKSARSMLLVDLEYMSWESMGRDTKTEKKLKKIRRSDHIEQKDLEVGILAVGLTQMISSRIVQ